MLASALSEYMEADEKTMVELAGLLHDVGHGPFSHVFDPILMKHLQRSHEDVGMWLIEKTEIADIVKSEGFNPEEVKKLSIGKMSEAGKSFLDQIISSSVDADKMDFVLRDSYHTGAGYGNVDVHRLIYTMGVIDGNLAVNITALPTLEAFLLARLQSFRTIYFHRTVRAIQIMLEKSLEKANDELHFISLKSPDDFLELDDYTTWTLLKKCDKSKAIIEKLERRKILKCAYERVVFTPDDFTTSIFVNESVRLKLEEEISQRAGIDRESVIVDVPSLPSVPYRYPLRPSIPVFSLSKDGRKVPQRAEDLSKIIESLQAFMNILRVYTEEEFREKVSKVVRDIFGPPPSTKISL
jgi:hypothetical protein